LNNIALYFVNDMEEKGQKVILKDLQRGELA